MRNERGLVPLALLIIASIAFMLAGMELGRHNQMKEDFKEKGCVEHIVTADGTFTLRQGESMEFDDERF